MQRAFRTVAIALCSIAVLGCNTTGRQPKLEGAMINPATLRPGDTAVITVRVVDAHRIVDRIVGVVKEDPRMKFRMHDDGIAPDRTANDGIWSLQVDVPFMAPPGQFTLELTAYNREGGVIMVKDADLGSAPLSAECELIIEYPPESQGQG